MKKINNIIQSGLTLGVTQGVLGSIPGTGAISTSLGKASNFFPMMMGIAVLAYANKKFKVKK